MRKLYFSFLTLALMLVSVTVKAESLIGNLDQVKANFEDFEVYHYWNFTNMSFDGGEAGTWSVDAGADMSLTANMVPVTTPGFENIMVALGRSTKVSEPDLRYRDASRGLFEFGSGARELRVAGLLKGMIVVVEGWTTQNYDYFATGVLGTGEEEITDEVHQAQLDREVPEGETATADNYRYFRMLEDGNFRFSVQRSASIQSIAVLYNTAMGEVVSNPLLSIEKVLGDSRSILLTSGTSTMGNEVFTFYNFDAKDDDGNTLDPIAVKEVVDYYVGTDAEGAQVTYTVEQYENNEIPSEVVVEPVTKKVLDAETTFPDWDGESPLTADLYYGDGYLYSGESFNVQMADGVETEWDDQGVATKAVVTVKYVTVSSAGVISEIMSTPVEIEYLKLNAPTLTLVGFDETLRQYKIGWENNKKNDREEYTIRWTADDDNRGGENVAIGDVIAFEHDATVTVSADGYDDGVLEMEAVDAGISYFRKNSVKEHDWDFANLAEEQKDLIQGRVIDHYYTADEEGNVIATYTIEEAAELLVDDTFELELQAAYKASGWTWDGNRSRAMRNPVVLETIYTDETEQNVDYYVFDGYEEDQTNLYNNGLSITGAEPYTGSTKFVGSSQYIYITSDNEGNGTGYLNLNGNAQLNFAPEVVKYGEYVVVTFIDQTVCNIVDWAEGYAYGVRNANIRYIDIFTRENLPEVPEELTGIAGVEAQKAAKSDVIYNIGGQRVNASYKGIVIKNGKKYLQR